MDEKKNHERLIRKPELFGLIGVSETTIWRWERDGKFPKRIDLGAKNVAWLASEINDWIAEKAAARE